MDVRACTSWAAERIEAFGEIASAIRALSAMARAVGSLIGAGGSIASADTCWVSAADAGPTVMP